MTVWPAPGHAENLAKEVKKAVERSTLDQSGTTAFHLRATVAPSFERDKESGRRGEVEIWWASPTQWKREVRAPELHQIEIMDGARDWQKNEGDYFPSGCNRPLFRPVPPLDQVLEQAKAAEILESRDHFLAAYPSAKPQNRRPRLVRIDPHVIHQHFRRERSG